MKDSTAPAVDQQRLVRLPKWAQKHIEELETRVRRAEQTIPWTEPGMEWFTVLHPASRAAEDKGKHRKLFMLGEDYAHAVCSIGPLDCVFVGRGKPNNPHQPPASRGLDGCDGAVCPNCGSTNIAGLMSSFWVDLNEEGEPTGSWEDWQSCSELSADRMCSDCDHEW